MSDDTGEIQPVDGDEPLLDEEPAPPAPAPMRPGVSRAVLGIVCIVVTGALIGADRLWPASAGQSVARVTAASPGGVLACPFLTTGSGKAWLHLVNAGADPSHVTITTVREGKGGPVFRTIDLPPGRTQTVPVDKSVQQPAGAIVEFAGGDVAASRTAAFTTADGRHGAVGSPCLRAGDRTLVASTGSTLGVETDLVLLNPTTSDAVVGVSFLYGGDEQAPEALKSFVVASRTRKTIRVADFAFDTKFVSSVVRVATGVVAADIVESSARGITLSPAVPPATYLSGVAQGDAGSVLMDVVALGDDDSVTDGYVTTPLGETAFDGLPTDLSPDTPLTVSPQVKKAPAIGISVDLRDGSPIAAAMRWIVSLPDGRTDVAASMATPPAARLVAVSGDPAAGAQTKLLISNPSSAPATVHLTLVGEQGVKPAGTLPDQTIDAGKVAAVPIGNVKGTFAVVADSTQQITMTLSSAVAGKKDLQAFSVSAVPLGGTVGVAVVTDPRIGVPARAG